MIGKRIGDFEILEEIGKGGMGRVYKAIQKSLNREVAIKVLSATLSSNEEFVERFDLEAKSVAKLMQSNIIQMYSKGVTEDGIHYFAMEFVHGEDLSSQIKRGVKYSEQEIIDLITQACRGLEEAQKFGIIHRDIKPSNILITDDGVVKIADFGLAKSLQATMKLTRTDVFMGTVNYTSPEQGLGKPLDHRTDIYSLGIVFYQLLTNKVPFDAETAAAIIYKHVHEKPERPRKINPNISLQAEEIVLKAIAKRPEDRYQSMTEFRKVLEALLATQSEKTTKKGSRFSPVTIAVCIALVIAGIVLYFVLTLSTESHRLDKIKSLIADVTDVDKAERVKQIYKTLKDKYPHNISLDLLKDKIDRMDEMLANSTAFSENIKSVKCIDDLRNTKGEILRFAKKYPEFEKNHIALNGFWETRVEEMEHGIKKDFDNAKNSIIQAVTREEISAIREIFINHVCSNYREFWFRELEDAGQKKLDELVYKEAMVLLSKAETAEDIEKINTKYKKLLQREEYTKIIAGKAEEKISGIIRRSIGTAKGICDLNNVEAEFAGYIQKYPEFKKQFDSQREEFERKDHLEFKTATANIDSKWNNEEIRDCAVQFKENHPCSKYSQALEKYAATRIERLNTVKTEYDAIVTGVNKAQDSKALEVMKKRIDIFSQENKGYPHVLKLRELWEEKHSMDNEEKAFEYAKSAIEQTKDPISVYEIYGDFKGKYPESKKVVVLEDLAKLKVAGINLTKARTEAEVNNILQEFWDRLRSEQHKNILKEKAEKQMETIRVSRTEGIGKKIADAKDLCELNRIEEDVKREYSGSEQTASITKQIETKRSEFERKNQSDLTTVTAVIDTQWNTEEIRDLASRFKETHPCSKYAGELEKYAVDRIGEVNKIEAEHDSLVTRIRQASDSKALESMKDSVNTFMRENKNYPNVVKLSEGFQKKRNELTIMAQEIPKEPVIQAPEIKAVLNAGDVFKDEVTGIEFVYIPGGAFPMGDLFGEGDGDEKQTQQITLEGFWMSKNEVTQGQWKIIMDDNPSYFKHGDNYPVEMVSWNDIQVFIQKLNVLQQGPHSFRLPREAEWEYASREGGRKVRFGNGDDILNPKKANFNAESRYKEPYSLAGEYRKKTTPVGSFPPNRLGLYDMTGNVWEWTQDNYESHSVKFVADNYSNNSMATGRVIRGGSWNFRPWFLRATHRDYFPPDTKLFDCGFRLVCSVKKKE